MSDRRVLAVLYPECEDVHLTKDIGMIPHVLGAHHGFDSRLYTHDRGPYARASEIPGVSLRVIGGREARAMRAAFAINRQSTAMGQKAKALALLPQARRLFARERIDALILYHYTLESMLVGRAFRQANPRGVLCLKLDMDPERARRVGVLDHLARGLMRADKWDLVVAETEALAAAAREHPALGAIGASIVVVPNGVPAERFPPRRPVAQRRDEVLVVGRLGDPQKGTDVALEAFARAAATRPSWRLVLVGPRHPAFEDMFARACAAHPPLGARTERRGAIADPQTLRETYAGAKILLHPARWEGMSFATIEAEASGTVLVASRIPSTEELTRGGATGRLVAVDDVEGFARELGALMDAPDELERLSVAACAHARKHYDWREGCARLAAAINARLG